MKQLSHILASSLLVLASAVALSSCKGGDEPGIDIEQYPIAFASVTAEEESVTRAAAGEEPLTRAATTLARDFVVYGYKNVGGTEQTVFDGYVVKYQAGSANTTEDNTHGYYYVGGNQTIKYWDFSATEYHFWGMSALSGVNASFAGDMHNVIDIKDLTLRVGEPDPEEVVYSTLTERKPVSTEVVELRFKRPYAKVCIQFYTNEPIVSESDNVYITNISFRPDPAATDQFVNKVYGKGDVRVTYPLTTGCPDGAKETVTLVSHSESQDALLFDDVTLTSTLGISSNTAVTAPIDESEGFRLDNMTGSSLNDPLTRVSSVTPGTRAGEEPGRKYFYYPLPMGDLNPAFIMQANIDDDIDPAPRTAIVPANFMQWKPNFLYTYIFKITGSGKKIEFYDVRIDPWMFGGSQDDEWKNW